MKNAGQFMAKLMALLVFAAAILYMAGFVWVAVAGGDAPIGIRWMYPFIPIG